MVAEAMPPRLPKALGIGGSAWQKVRLAPASLANETARATVSCDSGEPSVGTRICLNMVSPCP